MTTLGGDLSQVATTFDEGFLLDTNSTTVSGGTVSTLTSVSGGSTLGSSENLTTEKPWDLWFMPHGVFVTTIAILTAETILSIVSNILLIVTILYSPSLKTPPNAHLVNICVTNLALAFCMVLSLITTVCAGAALSVEAITILGDIQLFLMVTCMLQYWCVFSSIGYYRHRTIRKPSMSLKHRRIAIRKSIVIGWVFVLILGLAISGTYSKSRTSVSWNAFRGQISEKEISMMQWPNGGQRAILCVTLICICIGLLVIIHSYHLILKTLCIQQPFCVNKVTPWARAESLSSDDNDLMLTNRRSYKPEESVNGNRNQPFAISNGKIMPENFTVHYHKRTQSLTLDEIFALENPLRAHMHNMKNSSHRPLHGTLSNASNASINSQKNKPSFTDISPGAELQRFQKIKNTCALRNFSMRRDRVSLSGATKNSIIMLIAFLICTLPVFICSIPGVLPIISTENFTLTLLWCRMVFYLNAPVYPIWYLVFSKRVRKCLQRLYESFLIQINIRQ